VLFSYLIAPFSILLAVVFFTANKYFASTYSFSLIKVQAESVQRQVRKFCWLGRY
jgi:hypothetical protein